MSDVKQFEVALAGVEGAFEPQRQFQWILRVEGIVGSDVLELSLRTGNLPTESNEEIEIPYLNSRVYVAGKAMWEAGTFGFNDYLDKNTAAQVIAWRKKVYDPETNKVGYAKNYKKNGDLILYGPDYETKRIWKLEGLWPQQATYGALDMGSSDIVQIEINFRYDRAIPSKGF